MGDKTAIEWCDASWNPTRGCSRVSEGCRHCYAERVAGRFRDRGQPYHGLTGIHPSGERRWNGVVRLVPEMLDQPLRWKRPRKIFVNSMSDLFHESLPDEAIDQVFAVMALAPQHVFQVLTKRAERMRDYCSDRQARGRGINTIWNRQYLGPTISSDSDVEVWCTDHGIRRAVRDGWRDTINAGGGFDFFNRGYTNMAEKSWPLPNVWLGHSIENQEAADERIPLLLRTPAAVRFLSVEPLLGPVDLEHLRGSTFNALDGIDFECIGDIRDPLCPLDSGQPERGIDWVICGGESGPSARPLHPRWVRELRDQCIAAKVPFFWKQWGEWAETSNGKPGVVREACVDRSGRRTNSMNRDDFPQGASSQDGWQVMYRVGKKAAGRELDGRQWNEFPDCTVRPSR